MDFKRIEIIFTITFLCLNIFLLSSYLDKNKIVSYQNDSSLKINTLEEMKKESIEVPSKLSDEKIAVPFVKAENEDLLEQNLSKLNKQTVKRMESSNLLYSILTSSFELMPAGREFKRSDLAKVDEFIKNDQILFGSEYQYFKFTPDKKELVYTQVANNIPITDGTGQITFHLDNDNRIISYEQTYAGPVKVTGKSRELISEKRAVELLYQNSEVQANSEIRKPILSYHRTLGLEDLSIYGPIWYVEVKTSNEVKIKLVNAIDGSIIKDMSNRTDATDSADEATDSAME